MLKPSNESLSNTTGTRYKVADKKEYKATYDDIEGGLEDSGKFYDKDVEITGDMDDYKIYIHNERGKFSGTFREMREEGVSILNESDFQAY